MKGSCTIVASVLAASTVAISSTGDRDVAYHHPCYNQNHQGNSSSSVKNGDTYAASDKEEKFAPRFDGLRFIETLVTAHR